MSNALKKKNKKMQPKFFKQDELLYMQKTSRAQTEIKVLTYNISSTLHDICIYVLHAKFGFGKVRLQRYLDNLKECSYKHVTGEYKKDVLYNKLRKVGIDLSEEYKKIPFREMLAIADREHPKTKQEAISLSGDMRWLYESYMTMCIHCLKATYKFSNKNVTKMMEEMEYVINSFWRGDVSRVDIAMVMIEEVGRTYKLD